MFKLIKALIYAKSKAFWTGFVGGGIGFGNIIFADVSPEHTVLIQYVFKSLGAVLVAFFTGIAGALGKDYIDYRKEKRKLKNKKEEGEKFIESHRDKWNKNGTHN